MAIAGVEAGKHVYVEKPCSHNPAEGALLIEAQKKYGKLVQMGTQQRSSPHTIEIVEKIHDGRDRPRLLREGLVLQHAQIDRRRQRCARCRRRSTGICGRVPRRAGRTRTTSSPTTGTGSASGAPARRSTTAPMRWTSAAGRWASTIPNRVTASGGRYHYKDDWQFYDTLVTNYEYDDKLIAWDCRCCNGMKIYNRDRGSTIMGTNGSVLVDRDGYEVYDLSGHKTDEFRVKKEATSSADLVGRDSMTNDHFANFIAGVTKGEKLRSPVEVGNVAVTMLQLSNIAWEVQRELKLDTSNGKIVGDAGGHAGLGPRI